MRRFVFAFVASCSLAAATGCQVNPATGRTQFIMTSPQEVMALGEQARPELVREYGGEVPQAELRHYVDRVGRALVQHVESEFRDINWTFTVLNSDVINAFALPGGHVFISRGLLARFNNEAQLAGVLGHEIGHVTGQHVDERISQAMASELGIGIIGAATESQIAVMAAQLVSGGYQLRFGRNQETEADTLGMRYMVQAGYDPHGMLEVLYVLQEAAGTGRTPEFLSTHPHPETRINTVTRLLEGDYAYTQNNAQYQKFRDRFQQQAMPHLRGAATMNPLNALYASRMLGGCGPECQHAH